MKICSFRFCEKTFSPSRKNQKYCDTECCKSEMNARAKDSYAEKRSIRLGSVRYCASCGGKLSKYNEEPVCGPCQLKPAVEQKAKMRQKVDD